jgi:hypothetical protein
MFEHAQPATFARRILDLGLVGVLACSSRASVAPTHAESAPELVATASETGMLPERGPDPQALLAAEPPPLNDSSLTWSVYQAAGIPDIEQPWSAEDYERAALALSKMADTGRADLPRAGSPRSGAVFARLIDVANFSSLQAAGPAAPRALLAQRYLAVLPVFLRLYSPANDGLDFATEQARLVVALLELLKLTLQTSQAYAADDAGWQDRYDQQKAITLAVLRGVDAMLGETERYRPALLQGLKQQALRLLPALSRHLDETQRQHLPSFQG